MRHPSFFRLLFASVFSFALLGASAHAQNINVQADASTGLLWRPSTLFSNTTNTGAITTVGTLTSGTWHATPIGNSYLANSAITIAGTSTSLGSSITLDTITGLSTTGLIKRTGANTLAIATSGTDYAPATSGSSLLYGNGAGGFSNATVGTSLSFSAGSLNAVQDIRTSASPTFAGLTLSGLTSGRVPYVTTGGLLTDSANLTFDGTTGLGVADGFTLTSAGSIAFAAGGSNKNITLSPSGTGEVAVNYNAGYSASGVNGVHIFGGNSGNIAFWNDAIGATPFFIGRRANGTAASPTATALNDVIVQLAGRGYGTSYTGTRGYFSINADETWTATANGTRATILTTANGTTGTTASMTLWNYGRMVLAPVSGTTTAWGTTGALNAFGSSTVTDSSSSGTVATAVANSFAVPTFAASSSTTFTNAANLYIAGDVSAGTNVTLTNSYGLWNVGKTKLEGTVRQDVTQSTGFTLASLNGIVQGSTFQTLAGLGLDVRSDQTGTPGSDIIGFSTNVRSVNTGTVGQLTGSRVINIVSGGATVTSGNGYVSRSPSVSSGTITTQYGFYAERQKIAAGVTTGYAFYNADANDLNYFAGAVQLPSTNTAGLQLYNTSDQTTNYERGGLRWSSNNFDVFTEQGGTGNVRTFRVTAANNILAVANTASASAGYFDFLRTTTSAASSALATFRTTNTATSGTMGFVTITPTYNQSSGTAANTDLLINRTQTAVGSGAQLLIDAQVGGSSKFAVNNSGVVSQYNGIATAGNGVVTVQGVGRATAQTAANASVATYTVGSSDASFEVSANVLVTTSSAENFTVTCAYTDEGNTARTITLNFQLLAGTIGTGIAFANGAVPYEGVPLHIRAKASTAITIATTGTFTGCTYNVEGVIRKLQ